MHGGGDLKLVELLFEYGAEINTRIGTLEITPLMFSAALGRTDIVTFLVRNRANINASANNGVTAFQVARSEGHLEIANVILSTVLKASRNIEFALAVRRGLVDVVYAKVPLQTTLEITRALTEGSPLITEMSRVQIQHILFLELLDRERKSDRVRSEFWSSLG